MSILEYISSERFIHDDIIEQVESALLNTIYESWRDRGHIDPFLFSWPQEHIRCDDGTTVTHFFNADLPEDRSTWNAWFKAAVEKTKPYALLLGEQQEDEVVVIFESHHGSRSWRFKIERHGADNVLGEPSTRDDVDSIGILWRAEKAVN